MYLSLRFYLYYHYRIFQGYFLINIRKNKKEQRIMSFKIKEGKKYDIRIHDLGDSGEGVGRIEGMTVFVEGLVPGDRALVEIVKVKKSYAIGKPVQIKENSDIKQEPPCIHFPECGGCQIQNLIYQKQLKFKKLKVEAALERIGGLDNINVNETIGMKDPFHFRNKAQLPLAKENGNVVIGFYRKKSHEIVDIKKCLIQNSLNDEIIEALREFLSSVDYPIYDEVLHKGLLRHLILRNSFKTGDIMAVLVTNGRSFPKKKEIVSLLTSKFPQIKTVIQNINSKKTNVITGPESKVLFGSGRITDYIGDLAFELSPLSFLQVNTKQTEILYEKVMEYADIGPEDIVFDIYSGIGTISLFLARKAKKVYGIEVVKPAVDDANHNAELNGITNVEFHSGRAEKVVPRLYESGIRADVVVVDPPRKGCEKVVLDTIAHMKPKRLVYISCKPSTLARDLAYLKRKGYVTKEVQPVDLFPHSTHVETVVLLEKK